MNIRFGLIGLCVAMLAGCSDRGGATGVGSCGDLLVRGNVYTPYGVQMIDCALAEEVAREVVQSETRKAGFQASSCSEEQ